MQEKNTRKNEKPGPREAVGYSNKIILLKQ
jgi:hypothetical protein